MTSNGKTIGQAIDEVIAALEPLDEAARSTAIRAACEHLGITSPLMGGTHRNLAAAPEAADEVASTAAPKNPVAPSVHDIRSFRTLKQPKSAVEMACLVAYYLESMAPPEHRKAAIATADLEKYFKQAGHPLSKRMPQVLVDARGAGYFDVAERAQYKLNPVGHNLVVHSLPRTKA
jgi:hypothetical protein